MQLPVPARVRPGEPSSRTSTAVAIRHRGVVTAATGLRFLPAHLIGSIGSRSRRKGWTPPFAEVHPSRCCCRYSGRSSRVRCWSSIRASRRAPSGLIVVRNPEHTRFRWYARFASSRRVIDHLLSLAVTVSDRLRLRLRVCARALTRRRARDGRRRHARRRSHVVTAPGVTRWLGWLATVPV